MTQTIYDLADDLSKKMGVPPVFSSFVETGLILYLPVARVCSDGVKRYPGVYVNPDAIRTQPGSKGAFDNHAK